MQNGTQLAAIDLGSNSFRLEIGVVFDQHIQRADYLKDIVRQGTGLDSERNLTEDAMLRGVECLRRFGERLSGFSPAHVRAVATQTLREAKNRDIFLARGEQALGFPIEVISGQDEARLIYQGVSRLLHQSTERRLVVDIGGRSTELILGREHTSTTQESFRMGSVAWSTRFFPNGALNPYAFEQAELAAESMVEASATTFGAAEWDIAYGSSGTIGAVADMLEAANWPKGVITREGLNWLTTQFKRAVHVNDVPLAGLKEERRAVIAGGICVLRAIFSALDISVMTVASGSLRHGVLFNMLIAETAVDLRSSALAVFSKRLYVDNRQVERVRATSVALLDSLALALAWPHERALRCRTQIAWAAQVHEVGHAISPVESHRHGAYILKNADIAGFSYGELQRLSTFVLGQRGKLRKLEIDHADVEAMALLMCFRLGLLLCHARQEPDLIGTRLRAVDGGFAFEVSQDWAKNHPQSIYLLREEVNAWTKSDHEFSLVIAA